MARVVDSRVVVVDGGGGLRRNSVHCIEQIGRLGGRAIRRRARARPPPCLRKWRESGRDSQGTPGGDGRDIGMIPQ